MGKLPKSLGYAILKDEDAMPGNGKHAGKIMRDVPAEYLVWVYENGRSSKSVTAYVVDNKLRIYREAGKPLPGTVFASMPIKSRNR